MLDQKPHTNPRPSTSTSGTVAKGHSQVASISDDELVQKLLAFNIDPESDHGDEPDDEPVDGDGSDKYRAKSAPKAHTKKKVSKRDRNLLRSTVKRVVDATAGTTHDIRSWRMDDWAYKRDPCPFPTRARGLFTETVDGQHRIVARGYDKFFNVGEVSWTKVRLPPHPHHRLQSYHSNWLLNSVGNLA